MLLCDSAKLISKVINSPLVSVIMPMFNAENTIKEAVASVQAQTYENWEMLVIDNCSTDSSRDLVKGSIRQDSRISLIDSDYNSGGPARPRNIGIKNARGKYLAFLDSDDLWSADRLKKGVEFLEENSEYFLVYSKSLIKRNGGVSGVTPIKAYSGDVFNQLYLEFNFIPILTVLMLNQGLDKYLFPEEKKYVCADDWVLWLSIAREHKIGFIDEPLATYVLHGNNLSAASFKTLRCIKAAMDEFASFVPRRILIPAYFYYYCKFIEMGARQILKQAVTGLIRNGKRGETCK